MKQVSAFSYPLSATVGDILTVVAVAISAKGNHGKLQPKPFAAGGSRGLSKSNRFEKVILVF